MYSLFIYFLENNSLLIISVYNSIKVVLFLHQQSNPWLFPSTRWSFFFFFGWSIRWSLTVLPKWTNWHVTTCHMNLTLRLILWKCKKRKDIYTHTHIYKRDYLRSSLPFLPTKTWKPPGKKSQFLWRKTCLE